MNSTKTPYKALIAGCLLIALIPLAPAAFAADQPKQDNKATPETPLHEIGAPAAPAAATAAPAASAPSVPAAAPAVPAPSAPVAAPAPSAPAPRHGDVEDDQTDRVSVGGSTVVAAGETVEGNAVAVLGPVTVNGTVNGNSVAVLGSNTINGTVHGNAVAVLGSMKLGPNARVDGNAVAVGGHVTKAPGAFVGGNVVQQANGIELGEDSEARSWWHHGLRMGRPVAFAPHLHILWLLNICLIALYALMALLFPGGIKKCGDTLAQRPGITFLTGFLTLIGLPVLFILLCVTIVGIPIALVVLPLAVLACVIFGKAAVYALVGHSIAGKQAHPSLAVLLGAVVVLVFYLVPILGLALWLLVAFLGYACALTTLFTSSKPPAPAAVPPAAPAAPAGPPPAAAAAVPVVPMAVPAPAEVSAAAPLPPPLAEPVPPALAPVPVAPAVAASVSKVSEAALPRAGFWIRMVALIIDVILIGIFTRMSGFFLPVLAIYGAILWKLRGSTIGGIIFGLKVVRLDGQSVEWVTVIVRALGCFLSLFCVGLGFIWIGFDAEKQSWHDKIAGTVVVRLPKGVSLV